jgi:hypothetical protein
MSVACHAPAECDATAASRPVTFWSVTPPISELNRFQGKSVVEGLASYAWTTSQFDSAASNDAAASGSRAENVACPSPSTSGRPAKSYVWNHTRPAWAWTASWR